MYSLGRHIRLYRFEDVRIVYYYRISSLSEGRRNSRMLRLAEHLLERYVVHVAALYIYIYTRCYKGEIRLCYLCLSLFLLKFVSENRLCL